MESVKIVNSYFIPDEPFVHAVKEAVRRGVDVQLVTNHPSTSDFSQMTIVARSMYQDILSVNSEAGVSAQVTLLEWAGDEHLANGEGQHHGKYAIFDDEVVIVGSYNIDPRSQNLNSESIVIFAGLEAAKPYVDLYEFEASAANCLVVTWEEALTYNDPQNLFEKLKLEISKMLSPLF